MTNLWMMFYGLAHFGQGLALIVSLGFWNPHLAERASMSFARWHLKKKQEEMS